MWGTIVREGNNIIQPAKATDMPQLNIGEHLWTVTHYELTGKEGKCVMMYGDIVDHGQTFSVYCKMHLRKNLGMQSKLMMANLMISKSTELDLKAFIGKTFRVTLKRQNIPNVPKSIGHFMWLSVVGKILSKEQ